VARLPRVLLPVDGARDIPLVAVYDRRPAGRRRACGLGRPGLAAGDHSGRISPPSDRTGAPTDDFAVLTQLLCRLPVHVRPEVSTMAGTEYRLAEWAELTGETLPEGVLERAEDVDRDEFEWGR